MSRVDVPRVDVVVVSFNSRLTLRSCIQPLAKRHDVRVIVVDNASGDDSLETIAGLGVDVIALEENRGFAFGCNVGAREGTAPFVLFLNPDATLEPDGLEALVERIESESGIGAIAPRILDEDGGLQFSQRRFPRVRSTFARATFLHRIIPRFRWTDELVRDRAAYGSFRTTEWVSGACLLVRRLAFEGLGGFDEGFFMYCEDADLCLRLRRAGYTVAFEPAAVAVHRGGVSAPRSSLLPTLAASRVRFARKHYGAVRALLERLGLLLEALIRAVVARGASVRVGHLRSILSLLAFSRTGRR